MGGWTQTPNFIYDLMPDMKEAEMKVVMAVVRQTVGWQQEKVTLRLADLVQLTGLSHPSVNTGIKAAMERGILAREIDGDTFTYWLTEPTECNDSVKNFNSDAVNEGQESAPQSKKSLHSSVKNLNSDSVKNLNTNKRNINTNKPEQEKAEGIAADAAPSLPPPSAPAKQKPKRSRKSQTPPNTSAAPPREPTEWQEFVGAFCWLCHSHKEVRTLTKEQSGALLSEAKAVHDEGYTVMDLREWYKRIWPQSWQWKKDRSRPKPADVRSSIAQLRAETPEGFEVAGLVVPVNSNVASNRQAVTNVFAKLRAQQEVNGHG